MLSKKSQSIITTKMSSSFYNMKDYLKKTRNLKVISQEDRQREETFV